MELVVSSGSAPAFRVSVLASDPVDKLLVSVARHIRVPKDAVRLSWNGRLLEAQETVSSYGLLAGDTLMLHVRKCYTAHGQHASTGTSSVRADQFGFFVDVLTVDGKLIYHCLLYTSPSPRDRQISRMPSSA